MAKIDYHQLGDQFRKLLVNEQSAQWEQGKFLHDNEIVSDGELQRFGREVNRVPSTLKKRREVYVQFREHFPEGPPVDLAFGVLANLVRITDPEWREEFLRDNPRATVSLAEKAVNAELANQRNSRTPRSKTSDYVVVGGVKVDVTVRDDSRGDILITGAGKVGTVALDELTGDWRVSFTL